MGRISPVGKLLMLLILGVPGVFFAFSLIYLSAFALGLIPCTWDAILASKLPRTAEVTKCEDVGFGYRFTARLSRAQFTAYAIGLGFRPDRTVAQPTKTAPSAGKSWETGRDGAIHLSEDSEYYMIEMWWDNGILDAYYTEF